MSRPAPGGGDDDEPPMTDERRHRGPHPSDAGLFTQDAAPILRRAVADLSWLLERGYTAKAALKLVGDRFELRERQRLAVLRSACADTDAAARRERRLDIDGLAGRKLAVDGFNCLITTEAALAGGLLLRGRDSALRDLASVHGSYHDVEETERALTLLGMAIERGRPAEVRWYLDRPVSNSGRLREHIDRLARARGWAWQIEVVDNPDRAIAASAWVVASTDAWLLDHSPGWVCLPDAVAATGWLIDLR